MKKLTVTSKTTFTNVSYTNDDDVDNIILKIWFYLNLRPLKFDRQTELSDFLLLKLLVDSERAPDRVSALGPVRVSALSDARHAEVDVACGRVGDTELEKLQKCLQFASWNSEEGV